MLEANLINKNGRVHIPVGQIEWSVPGTYQWTCPEDVEFVSVIVIAPGGITELVPVAGRVSYSSGYGGGVRFRNKIPVTPGEIYTIVVGSPGVQAYNVIGTVKSINNNSSAFGIIAGTRLSGTTLNQTVSGGYGGWGNYPGKSGLLTNRTNNPGSETSQTRKGEGIIRQGNEYVRSYSGYGGGGYVSFSGSNSGSTINPGGSGHVRIIWGDNREFPSMNIGDL